MRPLTSIGLVCKKKHDKFAKHNGFKMRMFQSEYVFSNIFKYILKF